MRHSASTLFLAFACTILPAALAGNAWSDPGAFLSYTKLNPPTLATAGITLDDNDELGDAVEGLGDLDGAGPSVAAIAVGAIMDDDGGSDHGAVYILFLNAAGNVLSKQKISSTSGNFTATLNTYDQFGSAVSWLGDLDGAGPSAGALAVGAINDDTGGADRGAVYILFLNTAGSVISYQKIASGIGGFTGVLDNGDEFGGATAFLGDLDGPGPSVAALAVGANRDDDGGLDRGAAWVLFLSPSGTVLSNAKVSNDTPNMAGAITDTDGFAEKLAGLGDLDGAGPSVVALASSAVSNDDGGNDRGAVHVVFLNAAGGVFSYQTISSTQGNFNGTLNNEDNFGSGLAALGDLDGAGPSAGALAVGSAGADGLGSNRGHVHVLLLDETGNVLSYHDVGSQTGTLNGQLDDTDEFGSGIGAAGDVNGAGSGAQTMLVGVAFDDDGGANRGAVYLIQLDGTSTVGVGQPPSATGAFGVSQVRPNPFSAGASVSFRLAEASRVQIEVLDLTGRRVRHLVDRQAGPGDQQVAWDGLDDSGRPLANGAYLLRMSINGVALNRVTKAVLLR